MNFSKKINQKFRSFDSLINPKLKGAKRNLTVLPTDIYLVSYPKSGNTWIRFLLSNLLLEEEATFSKIAAKIPDIYITPDKELLKLPNPRIIKSHEYFDPRYEKVIYLVRDPRDVLLSYYFHCLKFYVIDETISIEDFSKGFIEGKYSYITKSNYIGTWAENVGSWLGARGSDKNFLLIRYEDMKPNPKKELDKIAQFLNLDVSESSLENAIKNSLPEKMRELEIKENAVWPNNRARKDISFVRSAKAENWKTQLAGIILEEIEARWSEIMKTLHYSKSHYQNYPNKLN